MLNSAVKTANFSRQYNTGAASPRSRECSCREETTKSREKSRRRVSKERGRRETTIVSI